MKRIIIALLALITLIAPADAQSQQQEAINRIKSKGVSYHWGEAHNSSEEEAKKAALQDLVNSLKQTVSAENSLRETQSGDTYSANQTSHFEVAAAATLENTKTITYHDGEQWVAFQYITDKDYRASITRRCQCIAELVEIGVKQEQELNIAGALKYYNWAQTMLNFYGDDVTFNLDEEPTKARPWLANHIPAVLDNIKVSLNYSKLLYDDYDYDHYTVNLDVTYNGTPVSNIDVSYFNGETNVGPTHGKNGMVTLKYPDLTNYKSIDFNIVYNYPEEAELYDRELAAACRNGRFVDYTSRSHVSIPVKIGKDKISAKDPKRDIAPSLQTAGPVMSDAAKPLETETINAIERPDATDKHQTLVTKMQQVEQAIRSKNYDSVKGLFTDGGFALFKIMMNSGNVSVSRSPKEYTIEQSSLVILGRGIPVSIKNGNHTSNETVVFRFDRYGMIKSVAYALTKRAEDDIFREADWNIESRYALLTFMQDYQTAFALKRTDYIEKIFSDGAIIVTGKVTGAPAKGRMIEGDFQGMRKQVNYTIYNKTQYVDKIKRDFANKKYIQIVFEDTYISKVRDSGLLDNEVLWIELKQQYTSSSYSDKGFLSLQINLRPENSQINVRTWTPVFMPLDELKKAYPIGM